MSNFDYQKIPPGYYDLIFKKNKGAQSEWHHRKFEFVENKIKKTENHLDIACGPGTFIGNYLINTKKKIGIDIARDQILYANQKYKSKNCLFLNFDGKKIPFKDKTFNTISLIELIEHLPIKKIEIILKEARRCLKDNGKIIITTPNYFSFWPLIEFIINKFSKVSYEDQHITKFNIYNIKNLAFRSDMKIEEIGTFNYFSPFLAIFSKKLSTFFSKIKFFDIKLGLLIYLVLKKNQKR